jgi:RNA polymerase sigma-B factor
LVELTASGTRLSRGWATEAHVRRSEERTLFARLHQEPGPSARDAILARFMPLARQLARRYRNLEDIDDLEQVAAIGLVKAIDRFEPERGLAFSSFAVPTILGELKRHLRDRGWSVRVPRDIQERAMRVDRVSNQLVSELGRAPTVAELAEHVDSTVELVLEALQAVTARHAVSLDQPRRDGEDGDERVLEVAVIETGFALAEDAAVIERLTAFLSERERAILDLRFRADLTQSQIAEIVGTSQMQVSRIIRNTIERLKTAAKRDS